MRNTYPVAKTAVAISTKAQSWPGFSTKRAGPVSQNAPNVPSIQTSASINGNQVMARVAGDGSARC
jgi:hypothetical protein